MAQPLPPKPERPELPPAGSSSGVTGWFAIACAVTVGVCLLTMFSFLSFNMAGPVIGLVAVLFAVTGLHYLTWGWWLTNRLRDRFPPEDDGL